MIASLRRMVGRLSDLTANTAAHPLVQLAVLIGCAAWFLLGGSEASLGSAMTIGGFILTQMVLNQQRRRENALHLKIDEMLVAMHGTRNELAGAEHAAEDEIEHLRSKREEDGDSPGRG